MLYNGIMVGTFQYFFFERDLFQESFLTIWMHGALEISAIVIAGAAGLTLGRGILFPGTLPRLQSFQIGARRAISIMIGLVPIFILAGFIEGFFTRLTELPDLLRGTFIFSCFGFVGAYFWLFPLMKYRNKDVPLYDADQLIPLLSRKFDVRPLRKTKEVFTATFTAFQKLFFKVLLSALGLAVIYAGIFFLLHGVEGTKEIDFKKFSLYNLYQFHSYSKFPKIFFPNLIAISTVVWLSLYYFRKKFEDTIKQPFQVNFLLFLKVLVIVGLFELAVLSQNGLVASLAILAIPFLSFWGIVSAIEGTSLPTAFGRMLNLLNGTKRHIFVTFLSLCLVSLLLLFLVDSPFTWLYIDVLQWNIAAADEVKAIVAFLSLLFINQWALFTLIPLIIYGQALEYFSAVEAKEATELSERVVQIGEKKVAYGIERE
jgi:hypothetical protein